MRCYQFGSSTCDLVETHFGIRSSKIDSHASLETLFSSLSAFQFPPNKLLHVILMHILRNEASPVESVKAYKFLEDSLFLHPIGSTSKAVPWIIGKAEAVFDDAVVNDSYVLGRGAMMGWGMRKEE